MQTTYKSDELYQAMLARKRANYQANAEVRQKRSAEARAYYAGHADQVKAKVGTYRKANSESIASWAREKRKDPNFVKAANERSRVYRSKPENKQVLAHRAMAYFSRKYMAMGASTKEQLIARWEYYGGKCWVCRQTASEMDHVKPLSKGGSNWPGNLKPICRSCNAKKSNTWPYVPALTN